MAVVGELLLSAVLQGLFDRFTSELLQFARQEGLRKQLDKWKKTLSRIQKVLADAEDTQYTDTSVKDWLDDLKDLAYDVEDILDEVATEAALRRMFMAGGGQASTSKVRKLVPWFASLSPSSVGIKIKLTSKIKKITDRFNDLVTQKDQLNLKENSTPRRSKRRDQIPSPASVVTKDHIYGREEVKSLVLQLLTSDKHSDDFTKLNVIPIVGMGGIGKTTLAQLVYSDEKVRSFFDLKAWARVSEDFDVARVTKTILQSVSKELDCSDKDLNWLQAELKEELLGKKFLVILDDVWNENIDDWNLLRVPFEAGAPGSSIIVTTRNQGVSSLMGSIKVRPFQLELLPTDACLSIFSLLALDAKDFSAHPDLKDIGEEIVERCKGLPLAVKAVGGLLRGTQDRNEWEKILKSKIWDIPENKSKIVPALMLSYDNLTSDLKRCFAYCSIFPKDYVFEENELILLWMAEGLIQPRQGWEMEDVGTEYFRNLLSKSFFQQSDLDKSRFLMHDLINDLAQSVAGNTCFRMEDGVGGSQHENLPKARHSSYLGSQYEVTKKFEVFSELTSLRTFLPLIVPYPGRCYLAHRVSLELVPKLRCLRVLSFKGYCITELSDSISGLKHLRYLNLSETRIRSLPESITSLYNLQTLLLEDCTSLRQLPSKLYNLVNLRHLNIKGAYHLERMPMHIGKLTCLQTLSNLVVGKENCSRLKELGHLKHLKGSLCVSRLENVIEPKDAKDAELIKKIKINVLSLKWSGEIDESRDRTSELEVLNGLRPHDALMELRLFNYGGTKFPNWLTPPSFPRIVSLTISNCWKCTSLPPLGQLTSLKTLSISGMDSVMSVGSEFCGNSRAQCFRSLEALSFAKMKEWKNWSPYEEFPNLRELSLDDCPKLLGKLPNKLPSLNKVEIINCELLVVPISSFPDLCKFRVENPRGLDMKGEMCGSKVTFKSINFYKSLPTISIEGHDTEGLAELELLTIKCCEELKNLLNVKNFNRPLPHLPLLHRLEIDSCPKLVSLVVEEVDQERLQLRIRSINIHNCIALQSLPKALMHNNTCLECINIEKCDALRHFARSHLPPTLKKLYITDCNSLKNLIENDGDDTNNSSCSGGITSLLEVLFVSNCRSLEFLTSSGELPTTLQSLEIQKCESLKFLTSSGELPTTLQRLEIDSCPSLEFLTSSGELPAKLQQLHICNCSKLESVAKSFHHNSFLASIWIFDCKNLQLLNGTGESLLPSSLRELFIFNCEKMQGLQNDIHNLTSLQDLEILSCPSILSFPREGFPMNLTKLGISDLKFTEALFDWGLDNLTSLNELRIIGCQHLLSFPNMALPASLTWLHIQDFSNLECLSSEGLRKLSSLKTLSIFDCENLTCFLDDGLPPSLLNIMIESCQKLRSFPKSGLPPSLQYLQISACPLLEECCKKDQRGEWCKIADIPYVGINGKYIYGTKTEE